MTDPIKETNVEQELPQLTEEELDLLYQFSYPLNQAFMIVENIEFHKLPANEVAERMKKLFRDAYRGTEKAISDIESRDDIIDKNIPHYARLKQALIGSKEELLKTIGNLSSYHRSKNYQEPRMIQELKKNMRQRLADIDPYMSQIGSNPLFKALREHTTAKNSSRPKRMASDYLK